METTPPISQASGYQKLGNKTLLLFISQQIAPSIIIFVGAILLSVLQENGIFKTTFISAWSWYFVFGAWALFALTFIITFLAAYLTYVTYLFMLDDDALKIKRGILSKEEISIPYRQIQDVDIERDISDRLWGVSRLAIITAGHEEAKEGEEDSTEGVFPAIDSELAESLQTELLKRADIEKVTDEK